MEGKVAAKAKAKTMPKALSPGQRLTYLRSLRAQSAAAASREAMPQAGDIGESWGQVKRALRKFF